MRIVQARPSDLDAVIGILAEATLWLASKGIDMWPREFPRPPVYACSTVAPVGATVLRYSSVDVEYEASVLGHHELLSLPILDPARFALI